MTKETAQATASGPPGRPISGGSAAYWIGGAVLFGLVAWYCAPLPWGMIGARTVFGLGAAALLGLALRGTRRKVFYGASVTWHQSFSFEVVVQCAQFLSPFLPRRSFELEFTLCETQQHPDRVRAWYDARALTISAGTPAAMAWAASLYGWPEAAAVLLLLAGGIFAAGLAVTPMKLRTAIAVVLGAACFAIEGAAVVWAAQDLADRRTLWTMYLLFTGAAEITLLPGALGAAELPALLGGGAAFAVLAIFHFWRLAWLTPLGLIYLPRYKFGVRDFLDASLMDRMRATRTLALSDRSAERARHDGPVYSIVIPAYNEAGRLPAYLEQIQAYMDRNPASFEVLVVDDGSKDATAEIVRAAEAEDSRIRLVAQPRNMGKGAAVRRGMLEARGWYVLFTDADGATPIEELDKFENPGARNVDIVIGSRKLHNDDAAAERAVLRKLMGAFFYRVVNLLAVPGVRDTQCGFKMLRRDVAQAIFTRMRENGWALDVELLYLAQRMGYVIVEIGVNWHEVEGSKVHPVRDSIRMIVAIFRIRWRHTGFTLHD